MDWFRYTFVGSATLSATTGNASRLIVAQRAQISEAVEDTYDVLGAHVIRGRPC